MSMFCTPYRNQSKLWVFSPLIYNRLNMSAYNALIIRILMKIKHMNFFCLCNCLIYPQQRQFLRFHKQCKATDSLTAVNNSKTIIKRQLNHQPKG